jgi:hypothetical protein
MAIPSGLDAQFGCKTETTYGTAVTVDRFMPLVEESVSHEIERLESSGILTGARVMRSQQWAAGAETIEGDLGFEVYDRGIGLLFTHMFGGLVTTGSGPYTHTFTPGTLTGKSLTMQIGRPDTGGTVRPFTIAGVKVASWEIACQVGEIATLGLSIVGKSITTATALATASYPSSIAPMVFTGGSVTIGGSSVSAKGFTLSGDNALDADRRFLGSGQTAEPLEAGLRTYEGTVDLEFSDLTQYARFTGGTEAALVLALSKGTSTVTITANARFDANAPAVSGRDGLVMQSVPFKCVGATTDAGAITAVLVNADSTP